MNMHTQHSLLVCGMASAHPCSLMSSDLCMRIHPPVCGKGTALPGASGECLRIPNQLLLNSELLC
jgi:hypothetical protein